MKKAPPGPPAGPSAEEDYPAGPAPEEPSEEEYAAGPEPEEPSEEEYAGEPEVEEPAPPMPQPPGPPPGSPSGGEDAGRIRHPSEMPEAPSAPPPAVVAEEEEPETDEDEEAEEDFEEEEEYFEDEEAMGLYDDNFAATLNLPPVVLKTKVIFAVFLAFFMVGTILGLALGGGETVVEGLQGVEKNVEVPRGRPRCGVAEKGQGCVLYLMNPEREDLTGRDFYSLAAQLTGVQKYMIETGNMRYANTRIKPGHIAQINIPPVR